MFTEAIICLKFGIDIFERTQVRTIAIWLAIQFIMSIGCLYACMLYHRKDNKVRFLVSFYLKYPSSNFLKGLSQGLILFAQCHLK